MLANTLFIDTLVDPFKATLIGDGNEGQLAVVANKLFVISESKGYLKVFDIGTHQLDKTFNFGWPNKPIAVAGSGNKVILALRNVEKFGN